MFLSNTVCYTEICFGIVGVMLVYLMTYIEGVTKDGVCIIARAKHFYKWNEISRVEIINKELCEIVFYNGSVITKQKYSKSEREHLIRLLHVHNIRVYEH